MMEGRFSQPDLVNRLAVAPERGPAQAWSALKGWLGLCPGSNQGTTVPSWLGDLKLDNMANLVLTLSDPLGCSSWCGPARTLSSLEDFLGLQPEAYGDADAFAAALPPWFRDLMPDNQAKFIVSLVFLLAISPSRGYTQALSALEGWLGLRPGAYRDADAFAAALPGWYSGLVPNNQAAVIIHLAGGLAVAPGRDDAHILAALEAVLGSEPSQFLSGPLIQNCVPNNALNLLVLWLNAAGFDHPAFLVGGEAAVAYVRQARTDWFQHPGERLDFFDALRPFRTFLLDQALERLHILRATGDDSNAKATEWCVLRWGEVLENPGILERLLETGEIKMGGEGSTLNFPSARMPWPFTHEKSRDRPPAHYFRDGYLPTFGTLSHHQGCLGIRHETALPSPPPTPTPHATSPDRTAELEEAIRSAGALETLLPPGSDLWLRTMFDEDGGLHWWAVRNTPVGLRILARGESRPGAEQELKSASWWFDLAIEQIWAGYEARPLAGTQDDLLAVEQFAAYLRKPALAAALREAARREPFERAFQGVAKAGHTRLAAVWSEILDLMSKRTPEATELRVLADCWDAVLGRAAEPWPALPDPTEPEALSRLTVREHRRRSELEEASRKHLDVLRLHLDLTPLWQTAPDPAAWADVDVLIQPQGPLWGFPMAWLDFGGEPLFSRVASTGSVVSLTLRDIARRDTPKAAEAPRQLLAAHWLDAASWERGMSGPVYLHASLEKLARRAGWSLVGLADDPEASAGLLRAALGAYPARVVVINAHGDENKAAVHLAGGKWDGGGADLSGVDLVFLVACGVGRLRQDGRHDVEGLFAELAAHHGRCAITARCPIADREAAAFAAEVVKCYLDEAADHSVPLPPFTRARALNRARRRLLAKDSPVPITTHLAAAFDIYNLG